MGWYDISCMDIILSIIKMDSMIKKSVIVASLLLSSFLSTMNAQQSAKGLKEPELKYALRVDFKQGVYSSYKMDEKTKVQRLYRDSITKNYQRILSYNFTQSPKSPNDETLPLITNIDSMKYAFKEGPTELIYDSQNPKAATVNTEFPDAISNMGLLNHQFALMYNPKTEVVKVDGVDQPGDIKWLRNYINDDNGEALDTAQKFTWLHAIADEQAIYIGDVSKSLIAGKMLISPDSVWKRPIRLRLDGIDCFDTVEIRVISYAKGEYVLEAISKALTPDYSHDARFFGVPAPVQIKTGKGTGKILVEITSSGWVKKVAFDYNIEIESMYKREPFTQKIETNSVWTLLGRYKW